MSADQTALDTALMEFLEAHRRGETPDLWAYWERFAAPENEWFLAGLFEIDFRERCRKASVAGSELPCFGRYLDSKHFWRYRRLACQAWSQMLFGGDDETLAASLGLLKFGEYKAVMIGGIGGFGTVIRAVCEHKTAIKMVAVKIPHFAEPSTTFLNDEIATIKALPKRRGFPTFLAIERHSRWQLCMVTPWVEGFSLSKWLTTSPTDRLRLDVCRQLLVLFDALREDALINHGDISPENIIISGTADTPVVHLIDFANAGVAFSKRANWPAITRAYAAPELLAGEEQRNGAASDLWSLAVILYETLMGIHPFGPVDVVTDSDYLLRLSAARLPTPLSDKWGKMPELLSRCLARYPADRAGVTLRGLLDSIPTMEEVLSASLDGPRDAHHSQQTDALLLGYLDCVLARYSMLDVPLIHREMRKAQYPLAQLIVDVPLLLHSDPENHHNKQRTESKLFVDRVSQQHARTIPTPTSLLQQLSSNASVSIVGQPGSGKSTLLHWMAHRWGLRCKAAMIGATAGAPPPPQYAPPLPSELLVPVILTCRALRKALATCTLADLIDLQLEHWSYSSTVRRQLRDQLLTRLRDGSAILLVDGLDELRELSEYVAAILNDFAMEQTCRIVVTCRPVGFGHVARILSRFSHVVIDDLPPDTRAQYVEQFARLVPGFDPGNLIDRVRSNSMLGRLCQSMLMLTLATQLGYAYPDVPDREIDIYERTIFLLLERQQAGMRPRISAEEFYPHIEALAHYMYNGGLVSISDTIIVNQFTAMRRNIHSHYDRERISVRSPSDLLEDLLDRVGILNIAGVQGAGTERTTRRQIQFIHQRFQEYLAGRGSSDHLAAGVTLGPGIKKDGGLTLRVTEVVTDWLSGRRELISRSTTLMPHAGDSEPAVTSEDFDSFPLWIAELGSESPGSAGEVLLSLLVAKEKSPELARALGVLALQALPDASSVSERTVAAVIEQSLNIATAGDFRREKPHTLLDIAVSRVATSQYGDIFRRTAVKRYLSPHTDSPDVHGLAYMAAAQSRAGQLADLQQQRDAFASSIALLRLPSAVDRTKGALDALLIHHHCAAANIECGCSRNGYERQQEELLDILLTQLKQGRGRVAAAAAWALTWMLGCKMLTDTVHVRPSEHVHDIALRVLRDPNSDALLLRNACWLVGVRRDRKVVHERRDWIMDLARVADGALRQIDLLTAIEVSANAEVVESLVNICSSTTDSMVRRIASFSLARAGYFNASMISPLYAMFIDERVDSADRDASLVSLVLIGNSEVWRLLSNCVRSRSAGEPYGLRDRAFLAFMMCGDADLVRDELLHSAEAGRSEYVRAYGWAMASMASGLGRGHLLKLKAHLNPMVSRAALDAMAKVALP